jgi:malate synthase
VRADKLREVTAGHDGTWVAHPALIPVARELFDEHMPQANQHKVRREDVKVSRDQLIAPSAGTITRAGFEGSVEVCVRYLAAWLDGNGCVPIHWLMEDAATAEISRTQLWQWLHHADPVGQGPHGDTLHLTDGTQIDFSLLDRVLLDLPMRLGDTRSMPGATRIGEAIALLHKLCHDSELAEFLTLPAYQYLD